MISADTSYSRFTQYPSSDLPLLHRLATSSSSSSSASTSLEKKNSEEEEEEESNAISWMSYEKYLSTLPDTDGTAKNTPPPPTAAEKANTRSAFQSNEICLIYETAPVIRGLTPTHHHGAAAAGVWNFAGIPSTSAASGHHGRSSVLIHGTLSCGGIGYANLLQSSSSSASSETENNNIFTQYVGKRTSENWFVKIAPVSTVISSSKAAGGGREEEGLAGYALMAFSERFDFKSRLITIPDLARETLS